MLTQISLGLAAILVLISLLFLFRRNTPKKLRIRLGIALVLGLVAIGLKLPALLKKDEPADPKMAMMEKFFSERLTRYSEQDKTRAFTKSCVPFQIGEVRKQYPQLSDSVLDLAALDTCSCMACYLSELPEFAKVEADISAGKGYGPSMNAHMDMNVMMEKARPCMEK